MTGGKKRESSGRCEQPPVHNERSKEYKRALLDLVWQSNDDYFIKSLYTYAKCLREAMNK